VRPPKRVHLPSGRVVTLAVTRIAEPRRRAPKARLFSELVELVESGDLELREGGQTVDVRCLDLRDFHALRAIATRAAWLAEGSIEVDCRNCGRTMTVQPCATFEVGPFSDGELDDAELDATLDLSTPHSIPAVPLGSSAVAKEVTLARLTVERAAPLHRALRRRRLVITDQVVRAMGIEALGPERDPRKIAAALSRCSEAAWRRLGERFLQAHYSPRLGAVTLCPECGARNDVDAPYEREFEPSTSPGQSNDQVFPEFDAFASSAQALFETRSGSGGAQVRLAVDEGVPACDDGGEPLMGAYVPPAGDPAAPVGTAEISVYYRTFRAIWDEDGPYDWEAELEETVDHELEHHAGWLVGHDPMDDEERGEIAREHARIVGTRTAARRDLATFLADLRGFVSRTWPIWVIVAAATLAITVCGR
jgi:hypothetical protein